MSMCTIHPCAHAHMVTGLAVRRRIRNSVWVILFAFSSNNSLIEANTLTAGLCVFPLFLRFFTVRNREDQTELEVHH